MFLSFLFEFVLKFDEKLLMGFEFAYMFSGMEIPENGSNLRIPRGWNGQVASGGRIGAWPREVPVSGVPGIILCGKSGGDLFQDALYSVVGDHLLLESIGTGFG